MFPSSDLQKERDPVSKTLCCDHKTQQWTYSRKQSNHKYREKYININYHVWPPKESANTLFWTPADSSVWDYVKVSIFRNRGQQGACILGAKLHGQLNLVQWCPLFMDSQYGTCHPSGTWSFEVGPRPLGNVCTPVSQQVLGRSRYHVDLVSGYLIL